MLSHKSIFTVAVVPVLRLGYRAFICANGVPLVYVDSHSKGDARARGQQLLRMMQPERAARA